MSHEYDKTVAIIGAGAAGCFAAIEVKRQYPNYRVVVLEAGAKPMAKLALTGGGRCNITNTFESIENLAEVYPRGDKLLRKLFYQFNNVSIIDWFEEEGIRFYAQNDNRIFPLSNDAMEIVRTLERLMKQYGVDLKYNCKAEKITAQTPELPTNGFEIQTSSLGRIIADFVIVTAGGTKQKALEQMLPERIKITPTAPSLFTFKIPIDELKALMGTVKNNVELALIGTKQKAKGSLLITDWGISGPATLKLSSYSAQYLAEKQYNAELKINWVADSEEAALQILKQFYGGKLVTTLRPEGFSDRLWRYLLARAEINEAMRYNELGSKAINRLVSVLCSDIYPIKGRAAFKDEFVTCGGVSLKSLNSNTLESKEYPGLFFAGEVLDIDAVTGGFNLQAAWTTAYVAARLGLPD